MHQAMSESKDTQEIHFFFGNIHLLILSNNTDKALYRVAAAGGFGSEPRRISEALIGPP
jgi:hypothetical protein